LHFDSTETINPSTDIYLSNFASKPLFRISKSGFSFFSDEQLHTILTQVRQFVRDFVVVLIHTGLRAGELQRLQWTNIDVKNRTLMIELSKSHKFWAIPINDTLHKHLLCLKSKAKKGQIYIFSRSEPGTQYSDLSHAFSRELKRIGIKGTLHMLRHTFASKLVQRSVNIYFVKELLGVISQNKATKTSCIFSR